MMEKTLGGDRLGSGKKMKVHLHGYERSTHDLGYLWRSTMSAGTLVPFMSEVALPGDTFDIDLNCDIKTHPTTGPLFGSYKVQLDVFICPIRLYQAQLHNNKLGIGMRMADVKLPIMQLNAKPFEIIDSRDPDNAQINPSCILSYLGIRGVGMTEEESTRNFNAVPLLAYWDIYKNYYANKQEEVGAVIHTPLEALIDIVSLSTVENPVASTNLLPEAPAVGTDNSLSLLGRFVVIHAVGTPPNLAQIMLNLSDGRTLSMAQLTNGTTTVVSTTQTDYQYNYNAYGNISLLSWRFVTETEMAYQAPVVETFNLDNIDTMRESIMEAIMSPTAFNIDTPGLTPYTWVLGSTSGFNHMLSTQEGLGLKTYQSDLFNNWLQTEWIDGANGISEITAIDTSGGSFTIDTLLLSRKVFDMLNRIAVSGGTYDDWLDAVYTHDRFTRVESPVYVGGLIKELVFQEVVSNTSSETGEGSQPLGTLAGKGVMSQKHKGGHIIAKVDEPSYIMGIISLTPRVDYSQGNKWDVHLLTMDDFHKPALDEIGFQELITEQMAWWSTTRNAVSGLWETISAGKQPAWINYMTNVNRTFGNFAVPLDEMFMTLNRRYEPSPTPGAGILDLTTYIDPSKFNNIFAVTSLDAQNFWAQISVDITARRKMSAKIMPNL